MKGLQISFLLLLAAAVFVSGFPREREVESVEDDTEEVPVPEGPVIAVPAGPSFGYIPSFYSIFPDFDLLSRIRGLVTRLRTQIGDSFGDIDWSKGNTTSTTKVIDGHVVTVNETSYQDDDSDLVLHVKVIDVKPTEGAEGVSDESPEITSPSTEESPSAAGSDESLGNEIPKQPEEGVAESLDYAYHPEETREHLIETRENLSPDYLDDVDTPVDEVDNDIEAYNPVPFKPIPLHDDITVNRIKEEDKGGMVMIPEDVEVFVPDNGHQYTVNANNEYVYNPRNMYETIPSSRFHYWPPSMSLRRFT